MELPNPDAIWNGMVYKASWEWECSLGRWLIGGLQLLRGNVINTTFVTFLSIAFLAAVSVYIMRILNIQELIWQLLAGGCIMFSPSAGSILTYYYCSDMYIFSYLLAVLAVWIMIKSESKGKIVYATVLIMLSLGIYQAFLGVAVILCFVYLLLMVLDKEKSWLEIRRQSFLFLAGGAGGVFLYLILSKLIQKVLVIKPVENRGFSSMGKIEPERILGLMSNCYEYTYQYFFSNAMINNAWGYRKEINFVSLVCFIVIICMIMRKCEISRFRKLLFALGLLIFPMALMSIVVYAPDVSVLDETGVLMLPGMNFVYIMIICLMLSIKGSIRQYKIFQGELDLILWEYYGCFYCLSFQGRHI